MASGGAVLPLLPAAELLGIGTIQVFNSQTPLQFGSIIGPWRPPQWSKPTLYMITVPAPYVQAPPSTLTQPVASGPGTVPGSAGSFTMSVTAKQPPANAQPKFLVFDGVRRASHSQPAVPTENPIQVNANVTDHILLKQARVTLEISMSDAMAAYAAGQWTGNASKSISCFQILDNLRSSRIPLTVTTRLKTYQNMFILDIRPDESVQTLHGLRASVDFMQIFVANVATQNVSARSQTTDATDTGSTQTTTPPAGVVANNQLPSTSTGIPSAPAIQAQQGTVPGAGTWSSNNTGSLPPADFQVDAFGIPQPN